MPESQILNVANMSFNTILENKIFCKKFLNLQYWNTGIGYLLFTCCKPTKRSNAQHLVESEKQRLYEENKKSGNVMQQPMDSYVCGINTSSESILIRSYLLFPR